MTCLHINEITKKIDFYLNRIGDYSSSIYRKLGPVANEQDIGARLVMTNRGLIESEGQAKAIYKVYDFNYLPDNVISELLEQIRDLIEECNCREEKKIKQVQTNNKKRVNLIRTIY
jgi:hypothetical protein